MGQLSASELELAIEKLKSHISPGSDQITAELTEAIGRTVHCGVHDVISSVRNWEELPQQSKESLCLFVRRTIKQTAAMTEAYQCSYQLDALFYPAFFFQVNSLCIRNYWGSSIWMSTCYQISCVHITRTVQIFEKNWNKMGYISEGR